MKRIHLILPIAGFAAAGLALAIPAQAEMQTFDAHAIRIDGFAGTLIVETGASVSIDITGDQEEVKKISTRMNGDTLVIRREDRSWLDEGTWNLNQVPNVTVKLIVPVGTPLEADGLIGKAQIGDIEARLDIEAVALEAKIGSVTEAEIDAAGGVAIDMSVVNGRLELDIAGSGNIKVKEAASVDLSIAGSGTLTIGDIKGGLEADIAGSGDIDVGSVHGPVVLSIAGAGDVDIAQGVADPLQLSILGTGQFDFGGEAVDPKIDILGPGSVRLKSYRGKLDSSGGDIKIGG
ncbi:MAG: DUF2807 domain-containing protein [Alphaproteobacteria bacterium]|nr:DUF2807 domain-containing protein [Alphaproteobacteria bacterium]